jgi:pimeloyl-ACP methyl ester carboxylesterase
MSQTEETYRVAYQDGYVRLSDVQLHYVDFGGTGEVVLALHGLVGSAHAFDAIAPLLVPHFRLVGLDLRGRGDSDWGMLETYNFNQYFVDLMGFLAALKLERFALLGTSLGGRLTRTYAMAHPEKVTRLVLNDSALGGGGIAETLAVARGLAKAPRAFASLEEAAAWFRSERAGLRRLNARDLAAWVRHYLAPSPTGGWAFQCDPAIIQGAIPLLLHRPELAGDPDYPSAVWEKIARLTMPVLIIRGALSTVIPRPSAERLVRALPRARLVEVPGVGHAPTLYEPEAQEALADFFGVPACAAAPATVPV